MDRLKLGHHIQHLEEKHQQLDDEIDRMEKTGIFVDHELVALKSRRLHLRDEIESCRGRLSK